MHAKLTFAVSVVAKLAVAVLSYLQLIYLHFHFPILLYQLFHILYGN